MTQPIRPRNRLAALATVLIPLAAASCTGDQQGDRGRPATLGEAPPRPTPASGLIGGHDSRTRMITAAGVTPIPGVEVGGYVDRFEHDMRAKTAGTGIDLTRRGQELVFSLPARVAFDGNGAAIAPTIRTTLDAVARTLAQYHQSYVDVSGFAEQTLDEGTADALSQSQARAVANYLQARGVLAARIGAQGYGRSATAAGRRIEIKLVPLTETDLLPPAAPSAAQ